MPFTISHAAAILPAARPLVRWRLLSAALIGSMVPDFGFFFPWKPARFETHSLDALVTFCLPAGLATYWVFQRLIRRPMLELLPPGAYLRWRSSAAPADYRSLKQWLFAAAGILGGAVTHLIWDAFTHEGARGVRMIPGLDDPVDIAGHQFGGPRLLQDGSSILGLAVVLAVLVFSLRPGRAGDATLPRRLARSERHLWIAAYLLTAAICSIVFFPLHRGLPRPLLSAVTLTGAAIAVLRGIGGALLAVSAVLALRLGGNSGPEIPALDPP